MNLRSVHPGSVVRCRKLGREFRALVTGKSAGYIAVEPLDRNVSYYRLRPREVVEVLEAAPANGQLRMGGF